MRSLAGHDPACSQLHGEVVQLERISPRVPDKPDSRILCRILCCAVPSLVAQNPACNPGKMPAKTRRITAGVARWAKGAGPL
jgi:hypothetical protein